MNNKSRTYNSIINIITGMGNQIFILILSFISRTVFIKTLGADYLGISGLYTNILTVLSLAELGLGNVMVYSLYKPIAENDTNRIAQLINFYKKLYRIIAVVILILGMILIPFLKYIVNSNLEIRDMQLYYILFLLSSVFSYVGIYKTTLINADQKAYIIKNYNSIATLIKIIIQITLVFLTHNYYLYLIIEVLCTLITNICLSKKAQKMYPFIKENRSLEKEEKKKIYKNMREIFLYRLGVIIMNSTDNILISMILGTIVVGYYSNYSMIINAITLFITVIINAVLSSIGNLNASSTPEKKNEIFNMLILIFHWITAVCSITFVMVINDFIKIWVGENYVLDLGTVIVITINFYLSNITNPVWMFRETLGLFKYTRYTKLIASFINLVLSIILGKIIGLAGIIMSTFIARMMTGMWYEPIKMYKDQFKKSAIDYFKRQSRYFIITCVSVISVILLTKWINIKNVYIVNILIKGIISFFLTNIIFYICCRKDIEYKNVEDKVLKKIFNGVKKKVLNSFNINQIEE